METSNKTPESLDDVKKRLFARAWSGMARGSLKLRVSIGLLILLILLGLARCHFFGDLGYRYAKALLPFSIPVVDEAQAVIPLLLQYQVADAYTGRRNGKLGETLRTGDHVFVSFKVGRPCWVTVFCIDSKGVQPVFGEGLDPLKVEKSEFYTLDFKLNDTLGPEIYYAVAKTDKFRFKKHVEPYLKRRFPKLTSKGPARSQFDLELPPQYQKKWFFFEHVAKPVAAE